MKNPSSADELRQIQEIVACQTGRPLCGEAVQQVLDVLFGAQYSQRDDVKHALTCAVEMQIALDEINAYRKDFSSRLGLLFFFVVITWIRSDTGSNILFHHGG